MNKQLSLTVQLNGINRITDIEKYYQLNLWDIQFRTRGTGCKTCPQLVPRGKMRLKSVYIYK